MKNILPDYKFNSTLITKYCDGFDNLGFHSDNEEQKSLSDIVTTYHLKKKTQNSRKTQNLIIISISHLGNQGLLCLEDLQIQVT